MSSPKRSKQSFNTDMIKKVFYDQDCPLSSFFVWVVIFVAIYFLFWMPDNQVILRTQHTKPFRIIKVSGRLRSVLALSTLLGGVVGYYVVKQGCSDQKGRSLWSVLWFFVSLVVLSLISQVCLAFAEKITLSDASTLMKELS